MDTFISDGWSTILLLIFGVAFILFVISRFLPRKAIFLIALIFSFICVAIVLISVEVVNSWDDLRFSFMTIAAFLGIWIGALIGIFTKKR
ncbi:MAG TPA: sodium:dicarboxylate symporter [Pseudogracilibacillus sp.]|nr:sodium:dicarboxylate symporter [Pseudogracilibacillus sp.]